MCCYLKMLDSLRSNSHDAKKGHDISISPCLGLENGGKQCKNGLSGSKSRAKVLVRMNS